MAYTIEKIKQDVISLSSKDFYLKHILRSDNWYFETILGASKEDSIRFTDDFRAIVSKSLEISFNNISIVGSCKTGCSLAPISEQHNKLFRSFSEESDIDIAIVSDKLFQRYWSLFRFSYSEVNKRHYKYISRGIYRGYINEKYLTLIDGCRKEWNEKAAKSKKILRSELYIKPEITYRLYRSWEDFEEYHIQSINEIKRSEM
ncbi:MAG: hypothetical protein PHC69_00615 [Ruminiclostridium sp.]|nr:hypothetical protein [Ruminiclostridium sp.]